MRAARPEPRNQGNRFWELSQDRLLGFEAVKNGVVPVEGLTYFEADVSAWGIVLEETCRPLIGSKLVSWVTGPGGCDFIGP